MGAEEREFAPPAPTRRACEAASVLGALLDDAALRWRAPAGADALLGLRAGEIGLIVGPSGSGKSTLLRRAARAWRVRGVRVIDAARTPVRDAPAVDLLPGSVEEAMRRLARFGLAEARCFVRRASELSDGQRARLALALACERAERLASECGAVGDEAGGAALMIDEFGAPLDDLTAQGVARTLRRAADGSGVRIVAATSRGGVERALSPDVVVRLALDGSARVERPAGGSSRRRGSPPVVIERGSMRDFGAFAHLHYRAGAPGRPVHVLRARLLGRGEDALVGALVVAMPTLNASWRGAAWPGAYDTGDARADAHRLNREVRTIARVVVDPRLRACGVATRLVRAYLREPLTVRTEAYAAMGACCPLFERAGMRVVRTPPPARHARLLDALAHCGVEPWRLAAPRTAFARAVEAHGAAFLERELRKWANDAGADRAHREDELYGLFRRACRVVGASPVAYAHDARG